ncbi:MAG: hypothetical protein KatS3mg111_3126 [Pirellulaceae bacterium]|nr:MAG: hypothetical protein KatS3mg111_3126 [Pirellulaceae bacterium]
MAVRDRNLFAWQAYVVTSAIISVGLLVGMFFLWRSASDSAKRLADLESQYQQARSDFQLSEKRVNRLLAMMGYGNYSESELQAMAAEMANDEKLAQVERDFAEQMKLFPQSFDVADKNLMRLPKFLMDTVRLRNEEIVQAREEVKRLEGELAATLQRERQKAADAVAAQQKAEADLRAARQQHAQELDRLNQEKEEILARFDAYRRDFEAVKANLVAENQRLKQLVAEQAETIAIQADRLNQFENPDFASPQGEIVRVADGGTIVWINLGRADGLRVGVPFSVIDESEINISNAQPKAKVEITHIVDDHLSRAGVVDYRISNPVVPGDKVYSPAWRPGRTVGFALVGLLDIDGDGRDDREQVKSLIRLAGGQVDAELDPQGNESGPGMTPNTSFLVLGTDLTIPENISPELRQQYQARQETYAKFLAEARRNGIITISLDKLMGYLKAEGTSRTIPLGDRIRGEDFPIRPRLNAPASNGGFQPRTP